MARDSGERSETFDHGSWSSVAKKGSANKTGPTSEGLDKVVKEIEAKQSKSHEGQYESVWAFKQRALDYVSEAFFREMKSRKEIVRIGGSAFLYFANEEQKERTLAEYGAMFRYAKEGDILQMTQIS